jgi:hypothetical protein
MVFWIVFNTLILFLCIDSVARWTNFRFPPMGEASYEKAHQVFHFPFQIHSSLEEMPKVASNHLFLWKPAQLQWDCGDGKGVFSELNGVIVPRSNVRCRQRAVLPDGKVVFDRMETVDAFHRRVTSWAPKKSKNHLLIFGGSHTWGHGVEDDQTLPSRIQKILGEGTTVYNLGFEGYGPNDILARIERTGLLENIPQKNGAAFYFAIPDHFGRAIGAMSVIGRWGSRLSAYDWRDGKFEFRGQYVSAWPLRTAIYRLLSLSYLIQSNVELPLLRERHYDRFVAFISRIKSLYQRKFGANNSFFFVLSSRNARKIDREVLLRKLSENHIAFLDDSPFDLDDYTREDVQIPHDQHPTAKAYEILAEQIVKDLKLKEILGNQSPASAASAEDE